MRHTQVTPHVSFALLSGGTGSRAAHSEPKQFYSLGGHPMVAHSLIPAVQEARIGEIIINAPDGFEDRTREIMDAYCGGKPYKIVPCGATRQESCRILAEAAEFDTLVLHEAARPFMGKILLSEIIDAGEINIGYCAPIPFSMCKIDAYSGQLVANIPRSEIFNIQLPQKFSTPILIEAHRKAAALGREYTEDTVLVSEMLGTSIHTLEGPSRNIKVTTPEDFHIAESILKKVQMT
ncbi:IspD/TarI family cytidylyltransferase [Salipiger mangrovisoli]|uniref:2-C-methyl-D-erythritol 4-phosphate cytidylyltransferase n=1 Tax=Salipiger mangrovisoli TaxID=2865933 RepID=A0ABR9XAM2_9RHOB|nr:2-C-methyl-D-erythritol 4-phosphate cytidylyltransferase [Salipiger mangrovisoli]MBE9640522.1 2-C-methyl-D-erythritol 4-phosphate cytidylyltransferase [Salipiger mangrovisoli]